MGTQISQNRRALALLKSHKRGVPNWMLSKRVSLQYTSVIYRLRNLGYEIDCVRLKDKGRFTNTYVYVLKGIK